MVPHPTNIKPDRRDNARGYADTPGQTGTAGSKPSGDRDAVVDQERQQEVAQQRTLLIDILGGQGE